MTIEPEAPLTWGAQLARAERVLAAAGVSAPHDEAIELLGTLLGAPAALLLAQPASPIRAQDAEQFDGWVARRAAGEAMPHITGRLLFMGLEFAVGRDSPLPAPGARRLVEITLELARRRPPGDLLAAEVGAGCGAVALALASLEPRFTRIYAVESSASALEAATANGARYLLNLVISWLAGDGLDSVPDPVDVVICGLLAQSALSAARLLEQAPATMRPGGALICGLDPEQVPEFSALVERALPTAHIWAEPHPDGAVLVAQLPRPSTGDAAFNSSNPRR